MHETMIDVQAKELLSNMTLSEKVSQMLHESPAIERLGIPAYNWWNECIHGIARSGKATIFPQVIGLAATFDRDLIYQIAKAISDEGRAKHHASVALGNRGQYKGLTFWAPNVNIFRDPRWGRGQETYGEDPYLTSLLGTAFVLGIQQESEGMLKAAACAKHFAVHSGPEELRHSFDAKVTMQDLYETYLPAFEALVKEANVEAVMGAYNRVNSEPACASKLLLETILRHQWGFKGHVVSDCWAIKDFHEHHKVTKTPQESVALAIESGCDLNCGCAYRYTEEAVKSGLLSEEAVDRSVLRLLKTKLKLGLIGEAKNNPWSHVGLDIINCAEHRELARIAAVRSLVLLKNNGVLPIQKSVSRIYVCGPTAFNPEALLGNYYGMSSRVVTPLEGIVDSVEEGVSIDYRKGTLLDRNKNNPSDWAVFEAKTTDVAILFLGLDSTLEGEEGDAIASLYKGDRPFLGLPENQLAFARNMKEAKVPLVVVLTGGSAISIGEIHEMADAVIMAWYPGEEGGTAIAQVLFGDEEPSGSLPVTFYYNESDLPPFDDYSMKGRTYRYFEKEPLYPFGFGLSYTNFVFSDLKVVASDELLDWDVSCTVSNTGQRKGNISVQLYLLPPAKTKDEHNHTPIASLRGVKCLQLQSCEQQTFHFTLSKKDFQLVDEKGERVVVEGTWNIHLGSCSPGQRGIDLGSPLPLSQEITII